MTPTESTASCNVVRILTHEEFAARHPHPPSPVYVKIDRHSDIPIDQQHETNIDRQPPEPIDRRAPLTYRVQMPKIDIARLNALRPKPKPSENPPGTARIPSDDAADPMEVDRVPMGRTLRKRKEKVAKHLKRGANEKERDSFRKAIRGGLFYPQIVNEDKDEYAVYRDEQGCTRDVDGHIINVCKADIRKLMERASRDEHSYICFQEHASSFTQTKLVPEIYTKNEINEMFYGVRGAQEKNEGDFQMKLDGVYYPLNDIISWLTTCMEEMRQDIAKIQRAADKHRSPSIDRHHSESIDRNNPTSIDDDPKNSHPMKSQPDFHTRAEID
ncbi:hypothetical protein F2Q68_00025654 [Brassica cretica]|uniref:Uncharacterized protein n=1 Tax=Brassica cretica TaxID=69181 RepID=A0A8S9IJ92_BRACR|nr:hypothetical protein F2Q68_00025654 [Brassica cretica]